jgi:pimeloyl-ACP methyl ester carboxylesterase
MEKVQSSDGTAIAFDRSGDGPPVILVPGLFQHRAIDPGTAELAALLAPRFTVFHYDRRGRGDSADTAPYAVEREVEDLGALIDAAGGAAALYGMSSGGALALEAAARGLAVTRLAVYEPPFTDNDGNIEPSEELAAGIAELVEAGRPGDAVALFMTASGVPAEAVAQMRQAPFWAGLESVAHTMPYDMTLMGDAALLSERASTITVPTLVLDGGASEPWGRRSADAVAAAVPGAERATLEGQTHEVAAEPLAPVLAEFFSRA